MSMEIKNTHNEGDKMSKKADDCKHPVNRLYSWFADEFGEKVHCVACCKCGKVLKGGC